jgi:class 3 adenylate cyclase/tetratricopeptide (TPR) repeat protein
MTFEEIVDQALAMLQRRGRVAYRTLKRQFTLDDEALEDLKAELIEAQRVAADEDGNVLVWTGGPVSPPTLATAPERAPHTYTPPYLAEKILTSRSALEGERKQVTVLFADLKGSMELLADRDPEEARQLLDPVLERMMAAVHRYEGTVNQVMGDGIMALFGAPIAHEDHAVRACYAALTMQASVKAYAAEVQRAKGVPLQIRVGLNTGEVVVRAIGSDLHMDYTAVGQTTHLAARMEQMAMPGSILITPQVLGLVEGYLQVKALGPVSIKGLSAPVAVYEVMGAGPVRTRLQAAAVRGLTRFVGRDAELEALRQMLERAGGGHGQVVALVGEPGMGKSRLVYEFIHSHRTHGWLLLESRSASYGRATPYLPVIDLLKGYWKIEDQDDPRTIRAKVTGQVLTLDEALQDTIPAVLSVLEALPEDSPFCALNPPQRRQRTLEALKHLLLRESQVQPLCLVFEDLHWIDAETQALLDSLVESLPTARLLLLVNYRPEYQHSWGSKTYYTQLRLDPLPTESAEELLQALLGDDPGLLPLKRLLIERTGGNPFFLEESVRTLVETQMLVGERGAYRLAQALPSIQVPATVQAVLAARIDRLLPEEKRLLQTAAVIGTEVPFTLLHAIADLPEEALHAALTRLQATEFLYETRLFPQLEYTFKHALTHEVAYGSLLQERRRALHGRIVEAIEQLYAGHLADQVERLAHHAVWGEVWEKAEIYCRQAGEKAYDRAAFRDAATDYEQALDAFRHFPEHPDRGHVLSKMAMVRFTQGDLDGAIVAARQALEMAGTLGDPALRIHASYRVGQAYAGMGEFGRSAEVLRGNLPALARGMPDLVLYYAIRSQALLARVLSELGEFAEARRLGEEALRLAMVKGQGDALIHAHWCLGLLYLTQGDLEGAVGVLDRALALGRTSVRGILSRSIAGSRGEAYVHAGRLAESLMLLEELGRDDLRSGALFSYSINLRRLSAGYLHAGRIDEAWQHANQALDLARQQHARGHEALALHQLGAVHTHADPPDAAQAETHYQQALALADELGMRPLVAHCHLGLGTLYAKTGPREQARAELSTAVTMYRAMEMTFWLSEAERALMEVEGH